MTELVADASRTMAPARMHINELPYVALIVEIVSRTQFLKGYLDGVRLKTS